MREKKVILRRVEFLLGELLFTVNERSYIEYVQRKFSNVLYISHMPDRISLLPKSEVKLIKSFLKQSQLESGLQRNYK